MTAWTQIARDALDGSENGLMSFGDTVKILTEAGFDGYGVDFRQATRTYYLPDGRTMAFPILPVGVPVAERFDVAVVREAIREAQTNAPGYTYPGFCDKVAAAGCAGYLVSFLGKRVLYYGRTGETHTEYFPGTGPQAGL